MKKLFLAGCISLATALPAAQAQTTWTVPTAYPDTNFHTRNLKEFAADVTQATDGALQMNILSNGALLKMPEIKRAVQTGQVQMGEIFLGTMANEAPIYSFDSIPFMAGGYDRAGDIWAVARPFVEARLDRQNLKVLYSVPWPAQGLYAKRPLQSIADFKGLKMRAPSPSTADFAKRLGAVPTVVQAADIPQAFMTGMVDTMITSSTTGAESQAWDFLTHFYPVATMFPQNIVFVNKAAWNKLDAATQERVMQAAARAEARGWEASSKEHDANTAILASHLKVQEPDPALQAQFEQIGQAMASDWLGRLDANERSAFENVLK